MHQNDILLISYFKKELDMPKDWHLTGTHAWNQLQAVEADSWRCGYCSYDVSSDKGLLNAAHDAFVRICPQCNGPTFFSSDHVQWPGAKIGAQVNKLTVEVKTVYEEARSSLTVNAFTGTVMLCRKLLMNIAVEKGAKQGLSFLDYVQWLITERYAPRGAEKWLDYIRIRGNEANHEIVVMTRDDAEAVLRLTEALLRAVFELPDSVPSLPAITKSEPPASQSAPASN